ncbi:tyrosine-protein phosphatase [Tropicimonas sp. IMCC34043]|uniref:tyrosine-protein phosphatase n=1 Tax=Tropicimonas sp. IMCC34043 TaxID=2248760 RepID=UPI000E248F3B|nr:tyrosine-protein phosphatase [Tropicimonas sp. IMCC34043]
MTLETEPGAQIPIAALPNMRDLGGWPTTDGRRVRRGLLFRSTDLDRLDVAGREELERRSLRTVIDLRTAAERQAKPDRLPTGATQIVCDVMADAADSAPTQLQKIIANPEESLDLLSDGKVATLFERGYRDFVSLPSAMAGYSRMFTTLAEDGYLPALFHCTTGKDRTGWAAAIMLTVLGVSREDVLRDYLLTNDQLLPALQPVMDRFEVEGGDPALLLPVLGVRAAYLQAAFDEVQRRFGFLQSYLVDGLGLDTALQQQLRAAFTE